MSQQPESEADTAIKALYQLIEAIGDQRLRRDMHAQLAIIDKARYHHRAQSRTVASLAATLLSGRGDKLYTMAALSEGTGLDESQAIDIAHNLIKRAEAKCH